jgi:DNA-binding CsgD family transcriptional regulator
VVLELASALATATTLSEATEQTLPVLAGACGAPLALFAVAGSQAAGARCWPRGADWSRTLESELTSLWDGGPLTELCRSLGVVPPFLVADLLQELGWDTLPFNLSVAGLPLRYVLYMPVAVFGRTVCGYFVGRTDREFAPDELDVVTRLQAPVVASHGQFLRANADSAVLTPRQLEILHLMQRGLTTGAIASRLGISESTVGKHLRDLYARLDTHDRVSTIREAQVHGLLDGVGSEAWQDVKFR